MVLPPSLSRKMGEIETVEAEKMGWLDLPRGTSYPLSPIWLYLQYYWAGLAQTCSLGPFAVSRILSLRLIHAMHALTSNIGFVFG